MAALSIYTAVYVTKTAFKRLIPSVKGCAGSIMVNSFLHTHAEHAYIRMCFVRRGL